MVLAPLLLFALSAHAGDIGTWRDLDADGSKLSVYLPADWKAESEKPSALTKTISRAGTVQGPGAAPITPVLVLTRSSNDDALKLLEDQTRALFPGLYVKDSASIPSYPGQFLVTYGDKDGEKVLQRIAVNTQIAVALTVPVASDPARRSEAARIVKKTKITLAVKGAQAPLPLSNTQGKSAAPVEGLVGPVMNQPAEACKTFLHRYSYVPKDDLDACEQANGYSARAMDVYTKIYSGTISNDMVFAILRVDNQEKLDCLVQIAKTFSGSMYADYMKKACL
jgi:hypothetical protein